MANIEIPGYELYEILGRGGMAIVYRALHLNLDREVAIKVMDTALNSDQTFSERFIREARISARLVHPHILQIYDVNSFDTLNYISMELLEAGDLSDLIAGPMPQRTIYDVMEQITEALDYASRKGYVHRDIKPSNIMMRGQDDYVLADFGIAKSANSGTQMTQTGLMVGTPSYMSPEQAKGLEIDGRSDLYSLAVLCFEMLTKELPYDSDSAVSTAVKHLTEDIPRLPENLAVYQPFIDKALSKEAADRFQSGREMYRAFSELRGQFSDDEVLTQPKEKPQKPKTTEGNFDISRTSIAWDDSTQVAHPSRPSRPYKLPNTGTHRESLVSGIRSGQRPVQKTGPAKPGSIGFRLFAGAVIIGALGYGGYSYWQGQQEASSQDLRKLTSELASAYGALNREDFEKAAIAFRRVLAMDSDHAGALQGMSEVAAAYVVAIEAVLDTDDLNEAQRLLTDYALNFSGSTSNVERFQSAIELARQEQQLVSAQSERIAILIAKADTALNEGRLFSPATDNAHEFIQQALELNADSEAAFEARSRLMDTGLQQVSHQAGRASFVIAREILARLRSVDSNHPGLEGALAGIERAEEVELRRQERWADFSEDKQRSILDDLAQAEDLLAKGVLSALEETKPGENALRFFLAVLEQDPENDSALTGPARISRAYISRAEDAQASYRFDRAEELLGQATEVDPDLPELPSAFAALEAARSVYADDAEFQSQINGLLEQAAAELEVVDSGARHAGEATSLYRKVLVLDPVNETALAGIAQLVEHHITSANEAMAYGEFQVAATALARAVELAPERDDILELQAGMAEKESAWLTSENVVLLVESGEKLLSEGDINTASEKFSTALRLEPANERAAQGLATTVDLFLERARKAIENGEFARAGDDLADAGVLAPEREDIIELEAQLPQLELAWIGENQLTEGLNEAKALYDKGHLSKAAEVYRDLGQAHPDSTAASEGFDQSIAALLKHVRLSIGRGDFSKAASTLASAASFAPDSASVGELQSELPALEQAWQAEQEQVARAEEAAVQLAHDSMIALATGNLVTPAENYARLAADYPDLDSTINLKNALLSAYADAARLEIDNASYDAAQQYLGLGQALSPGYAAWSELESELELSRSGGRRRLGAY